MEKVKIKNNSGEVEEVSKEFADFFKSCLKHSEELNNNSDKIEDIPIEEFADDFKEEEVKKSEDETLNKIQKWL